MVRFDWSDRVWDVISPADEVREAREEGRTLEEQAELLVEFLTDFWGCEAEDPERVRNDILAALEAAAASGIK